MRLRKHRVHLSHSSLYEDGYYPHAVVEAVAVGCLYGIANERFWYAWEDATERYRACPEPPGFENQIALGGIG